MTARSSMAMGAVVLAAVCVLAPSGIAAAQYRPPHTIIIVGGGPPPEKLRVGNQVYDFDLGGIEEYMQDLELRSPGAYRRLKVDYDALMVAESNGLTWAWMTAGVGVVMMIVGGVMMSNDELAGLWLFGIGVAGGTLGAWGVYAIVSPDRDDMRRFVNRHNQVNPERPLQLGARGGGRHLELGLRLRL